jgi:NRPS condensation-like uncharacterized protein
VAWEILKAAFELNVKLVEALQCKRAGNRRQSMAAAIGAQSWWLRSGSSSAT